MAKRVKHTTREGWLTAAAAVLAKQFFQKRKLKMPKKIQCSCGFPKHGGGDVIGQCWHPKASADKTAHIFICPTQAEPVQVLDILLHELMHAHFDHVSPDENIGHKGPFKKLAKELGLSGKPTSTFAEKGGELHKELTKIAKSLGKYPHAPLVPKKKPGAGSTWIRLESVKNPKYRVVISDKKLEEYGPPICPWGKKMVPIEKGSR